MKYAGKASVGQNFFAGYRYYFDFCLFWGGESVIVDLLFCKPVSSENVNLTY